MCGGLKLNPFSIRWEPSSIVWGSGIVTSLPGRAWRVPMGDTRTVGIRACQTYKSPLIQSENSLITWMRISANNLTLLSRSVGKISMLHSFRRNMNDKIDSAVTICYLVEPSITLNRCMPCFVDDIMSSEINYFLSDKFVHFVMMCIKIFHISECCMQL